MHRHKNVHNSHIFKTKSFSNLSSKNHLKKHITKKNHENLGSFIFSFFKKPDQKCTMKTKGNPVIAWQGGLEI